MSLLLDVLNGEKTHRPPVWFMRQAGRVLQVYRDLKKKHRFKELLENPELAIEVTLQPIRELEVDAAILFSDILVVPEALGMDLEFRETGPVFIKAIKDGFTICPSPHKLEPVYEVIKGVRQKLPIDKCLIGFCGGPLTVFAYMVEGFGSQGDFPNALKWLYHYRNNSLEILDAITDMSIHYVEQQIKAGIQVFQLFETWAGLIPFDLYQKIILPRVENILSKVRMANIPTIFFPRGIGLGLYKLPLSISTGLSIDWQMPLKDIFENTPKDLILQGNIDPRMLLHVANWKPEMEAYLNIGRQYHNWIINLGHGLLPGTPEATVKELVQWVKTVDWKR